MDLQQLLLTLTLILLLQIGSVVLGSGYQGCWQESIRNRHFFTSIGNYNAELMVPSFCQTKCGTFEYRYAALYNGKFCFCGHTLPTQAAVADSQCNIDCIGDNSEKCGDVFHVSVYETLQPIYGLQVSSDIPSVAEAPATATLTYGVERGLIVQYTVDYDDGAGFTDLNETGLGTRMLHLPGKYIVTMRAENPDSSSETLEASTAILLEGGPEDVDTECEIMTTYQEGSCEITVWKGSNLKLDANIPGQSSSITVNRLTDPKVELTGLWSSSPTGTVNSGSATHIFLLVGTAVSQAGRIYGWRVHVKATGTVAFMILRPKCTTGSYCPLSNTCTSSCNTGPDCSGASIPFCMQNAACTPSCTPLTKSFGSGSIPVDRYETVHLMTETFTSVGEQWVNPATPFDVTPGDIMGLEQNGPSTISTVDTSDKEDIQMPHGTPAVGTSFVTGTGMGGRHVVQPYVSYGSRTVLKYTFTGSAGEFPMIVGVRNNNGFGSSVTNYTQVIILEGIDFAIIVGPTFVKLGDSITYSLQPHTGSNVTYNWNVSNGHTDVGKPITYTFLSAGMFNLSVEAFNSVSRKENYTEITVQEAVTGVSITADDGEINDVILVNISLATGTDYNCEVTLGDGATVSINTPSSLPHIYTSSGSFITLVNCSNEVSSDTATHTVQIQGPQEPITDLRVESEGASPSSPFRIAWRVTTGTNMTFSLVFDGNSVAVDNGNSNPGGLLWVSVLMGPMPINGYPYTLTASNVVNNETITGVFFILGPLVGPTLNSDLNDVTTDDLVTFTVDVVSGSGVSVVIEYQDGSPNDTYVTTPAGAPWSGPRVFTHMFINGCSCSVTATISNAAGPHVVSVTVLVKVGFSVLSLPVSETDYYLYEPPAAVDSIYLNSAGPMPTDPTLTIDWGDGSPVEIKNTIQTNPPGYSWMYDEVKTYCLSLKLENSFSSRTFKHNAIVVEKLVGPKIALQFPSAPLNKPLNVTFSLYRGDQGNHTMIHWDFGDGSPATITERQGTGEDGADTLSVTYTSLGTKTATITATAPLNQSVSATVSIDVLRGVDEVSTVVTVNGDVTFGSLTTFTLKYNSASIPMNAFIKMDWYGDGSLISSAIPFTIATNGGTQTISHTYAKDGRFDAKMNIYNDASYITKIVQAGVYKNFVNIQADVTFKVNSDVPNPPRRDGLRGTGLLYPLDSLIYFMLTDDNNAFATSYMMVSTSGPESISMTATENDFPYNFTLDGSYSVDITASNPLYSTTVTVPFDIVKRVQNLQITEDKSIVSPGQPKRIKISTGGYDNDMCVYIDWDDNDQQHMYNNNPSACTETATYPNAFKIGDLNDLADGMATHRYFREGRYTITVEARNTYGVEVKTLEIPISYTICTSPELQIHNQETSIYYAPSFTRSSIVRTLGMANIECPHSYDNVKSWALEEVDADGQTLRNVDLSGIATERAELYIPALHLPLGIYKAIYSMTMLGGSGGEGFFTDSKFTYFKITQSELLGSLLDGRLTEMTLGSSQTIRLEPLMWSMDPDVDSSDPQGLTVVKWACQDLDGGGNATCSADLIDNAMTQDIDGSRWALGSKYKVIAYLKKGTRQAIASLVISMNGTSPPHAAIRCIQGSTCYPRGDGYTGLKSSKVSLQCDCATCGGSEIYEWKFFIEDYRWHEGWRPIRQPMIKENSISTFSKEFSIMRGLFEEYSSITDVIRAQCIVHQGSEMGKVSLNIYINEPPHHGNCTVTPLNATATIDNSKQWEVSCFNWRDEDGIKEFQVSSVFSEGEVVKEITSYPTPSHGFLQHVSLPIGPASRNYIQNVYVTIRDNLNAATRIKIGEVQVLPPPRDEAEKYLNAALNDDNSEFFKIFHEGDQRSVSEIASAVSNLMTENERQRRIEYADWYDVPANRLNTGYGQSDKNRPTAFATPPEVVNDTARFEYEKERDNQAQLKAKMLEFVEDLAMDDIISIHQLSSVLAEMTASPTDLNSKTQNVILDLNLKMLENLKDPVKMKNVPQEEIEKAMTNLMASVGGVIDAAGLTGLFPTLDELALVKLTPKWKVYDTSIEAIGDESDVSNANTYDEALWLHTKNVFKASAAKGSQDISDKSSEIMQKTARIFQSYSIPGQSLVSTGYRLKLRFEKNFVHNLLDTELLLPDSEAVIKLPANITDLYPDGSVRENDVLTIQFIQTTNVANRYGPQAQIYLPLEARTHFITIELYDENGNRTVVRETNTPIKINIPNDPNAPRNVKSIVQPFVSKGNRFQVHKTETRSPGSSIHLDFEMASDVQNLVVVKYNARPEAVDGGIDFSFLVPSIIPPDPSIARPYDIIIDNNMTNDQVGDWFIGIISRNISYVNTPLPTNAEIAERYPNNTGNFQAYNLTIKVSGCFSYTYGDDDWTNKGCLVGPETSSSLTSCMCSHLTTFAGGLLVVPNTIDWGFVFANADFLSNPTLYVTEIVIFALFIFLFLIARRKDKADVIKRGLAPLVDNDPMDRYFYEVTVCTGMRPNAGTNSKVYLVMASAEEESPVRFLCDSKRDSFKRGMSNAFLMAVPKCMGHIDYIRVWHDNSGKGKFGSWYLNFITIRDLQTEAKQVFVANRWFAVEEDDGQLDRIIPPANKEQLTDFSYQFGERSKKDMVDGHLWFSVVAKPPQSKFTCVERVACCLCLLFMTMLTNAMFYNIDDKDSNASFEIGPFSMSVTQISIGFMSTLIVFPANFLLVLLFRKSEFRRDKETNVTSTDQRKDVNVKTKRVETELKSKSGKRDMKETLNSSIETDETAKSKKKKKSWQLPWWGRIIAWFLLVILTAGSAVMVTFYGISFEDATCKKWISSLIFSFFTSVFITQPVKVFLTAVFLSLVIKNPISDDDEDEDEHDVKDVPSLNNINSDFLHPPGATSFQQNVNSPLKAKQLEEFRAKRMKEIQMWAVIREIIFFIMFLWILMVISHRNRSADNFHYKNTIFRTFIASLDTQIHFEKINNKEHFWSWAKSGLLNGLQAGSYYNDYPPLRLRTYINDKTSRILGHATLRQHRVKPAQCEVPSFFKSIVSECNEQYSFSNEETETFDRGWQKFNSTLNGTSTEYHFSTADELRGYPYWGFQAVYSGGGYIANLTGNKANILSLMERLQEEQWIDRYTRTVFVEFTVYNPQVNLFSVNLMLTEFDTTNGAVTSYRFEPAMLLPYGNSANTFYIICEILFLVFVAAFFILELRKLYQARLKYFLSFWNMVQLSILAFSIAAVVVYFYRLHETNKLTKQFKADQGNKYIKFQYVGYWNEILAYMTGFVVFLTTLKFLRLLRFNQRVSMLGNTLKNSSRQLFHFGIIAMVVFLAFCQLFFLTYMTIDEKYSTFVESVVTSILMMMGKFNIYVMIVAKPILTQIFVLLFVVTLTFIIVNMFVSILNDTFSDVRDNIQKHANEYEILEFMLERFQSYTGIHFIKKTRHDKSSHTGVQAFLDDDANENMKGDLMELRQFEGKKASNMDALPDKFERLLCSLSSSYLDTTYMPDMFEDNQAGKYAKSQAFIKEPFKSSKWTPETHNTNRRISFPRVNIN